MRTYIKARHHRHLLAHKLAYRLAGDIQAHVRTQRGSISPETAVLIDRIAYQTVLATIYEGYGLECIDSGCDLSVGDFVASHRDYINVCRSLTRSLETLGIRDETEEIPELHTYIASKLQARDDAEGL